MNSLMISPNNICTEHLLFDIKDEDKDNLLLQTKCNNKWLNKIVKLTFEVFGQSK